MTGTITGTGTVNKHGSGTVRFLGNSSTTQNTVYNFRNGICRFTNASLGNACLWTLGGILANIEGQDLSISSNLIKAESGGFQVDGANAVMTIDSGKRDEQEVLRVFEAVEKTRPVPYRVLRRPDLQRGVA